MEKNENISNVEIQSLIYTVRGRQVMLDSDVAMLYQHETKKINQTVKRNIERFPENFCFQLTEEEFQSLRSQFVTSNERKMSQLAKSLKEELNYDNVLRSQNVTLEQVNKNKVRGGRRYLPYVFTEQGIAMLAGLLKNDIAVQVSINIMNAFVEMRKFLIYNGQIFERLTNVEYKLLEHDKRFNEVFNRLQIKEEVKQKIFFEGQIYDAYSLIIKLIKRANKKIIIIDNYVDDSILQMLAKKKNQVKVVILTSNKSNIQNIDIQKFNKEYPTLKVLKTDKFHDRFIILDNKEMFHLGASIKDLGTKCFGINKMEDIEMIENIINLK